MDKREITIYFPSSEFSPLPSPHVKGSLPFPLFQCCRTNKQQAIYNIIWGEGDARWMKKMKKVFSFKNKVLLLVRVSVAEMFFFYTIDTS